MTSNSKRLALGAFAIAAKVAAAAFVVVALFLIADAVSAHASVEGATLRAGFGILLFCIALFLFAISHLIRKPPDGHHPSNSQ